MTLEVDRTVGAQLVEPVLAVDVADGAALRPHDERVRVRAARAVADAVEQLAVCHARGDEEDVVAAHELLGGQHPAEVVTGVDGAAALRVVLRPELALDHTTEALDGAGGDDAFGCPTDAEQEVDAGAVTGGHDGARDVAVGDELDSGARVADLLDQVAVAWAIENDDGDVLG